MNAYKTKKKNVKKDWRKKENAEVVFG